MVAVVAPSGSQVHRLLELTALEDALHRTASVDEALAGLTPDSAR